MCLDGRDALQSCPPGTVDERPGRLDRRAGAGIPGHRLLEDRQDILGVRDHETRHDTQLLHRQGEVAGQSLHVHEFYR
jgi:hypothetical protein